MMTCSNLVELDLHSLILLLFKGNTMSTQLSSPKKAVEKEPTSQPRSFNSFCI